MSESKHPIPVTSGPSSSMLGSTVRRHLVAVPVWAVRIAADGLRTGPGIALLLALDVCLCVLHRRANRLSEQSPVDRATFGEYNRWTKAFYMPEALAVAFVLRDLWRVYQLLTH
jgi:hypothetical protein